MFSGVRAVGGVHAPHAFIGWHSYIFVILQKA
jgi:hypothetical protein